MSIPPTAETCPAELAPTAEVVQLPLEPTTQRELAMIWIGSAEAAEHVDPPPM